MLSEPPVRLCCSERHWSVRCNDGQTMCCLCFERFPIEELSTDDEGHKWDVCIECDADEKARSVAIETARANLPIKKEVTRPELLDGYVITKDERGVYRVYDDSAWTPTAGGFLPLVQPVGAPIFHVKTDGAVESIWIARNTNPNLAVTIPKQPSDERVMGEW